MASSLVSCLVSYFEHARSPRPSSLLNVYLLVSLLLDAALLRTLWLSPPSLVGPAIQPVFTASFAAKAALLVLEAAGKARHLLPSSSNGGAAAAAAAVGLGPEQTAGIYARAVFAWVAPLLRTGFRRLLRPDDLFALDEQMTAAHLSERFWRVWEARRPNLGSDSHKYRLVTSCLLALRWPLAAVIVPRLVQLAFTICQPLVLNRFLLFLDNAKQPDRIGYGLVGAYGLVYIGIAVSQALYWHRNGRFVTMLRGVLVSAVFAKATQVSVMATDDAAAVTLMSSDVSAPQLNFFSGTEIRLIHPLGRGDCARFQGDQRVLGQPHPNCHCDLAIERPDRVCVRRAHHRLPGRSIGNHYRRAHGKKVSRRVARKDAKASR